MRMSSRTRSGGLARHSASPLIGSTKIGHDTPGSAQHALDVFAQRSFVIDNQNAAHSVASSGKPVIRLAASESRRRQFDHEAGPATISHLIPDAAIIHIQEACGQKQPEPQPALARF